MLWYEALLYCPHARLLAHFFEPQLCKSNGCINPHRQGFVDPMGEGWTQKSLESRILAGQNLQGF